MLAILAGAVMLCTAAPASAALTHLYTGSSFGPGGPGVGTFANPQGLAVDAEGDVYVYDASTSGGSVYKFDAAGNPVSFTASMTNVITGVGSGCCSAVQELAVSPAGETKGDLYVANGHVVGIYSSLTGEKVGELNKEVETTGAPEWKNACGVAVDAAGNVYVGLESGNVNRYVPKGKHAVNTDYTSSLWSLVGESCNLAIDSAEDVFVATWEHGPVTKYAPSELHAPASKEPPLLKTEVDASGSTLAVDRSTGALLVDEQNDLAEYELAVEPPARLSVSGATGPGALAGSFGVAATGTAGKETLYADSASSNGVVKIYGPAVIAAEVNSEAPTETGKTTATLHGSVNPDGLEITACLFEYKTAAEASFTKRTECEPKPSEIGKGTSPVAVSAKLSGLTAESTYDSRLAATDEHGTNYSGEETFQTAAAVDALSTGPAEAVTPSEATLTGALSPDGTDAHYYFEYGTSTSYGSLSPALPGTDAGIGGAECTPPGGPKCSPVAATTTLTGLAANTSYHYRLVAANSFGTTHGEDATLTTLGPPRIEPEGPENITHTSATVKAKIDPDGLDTQYHLVYGESTGYGTETPGVDIGGGEAPVPISVALTDLKIGATYHYRIVAVNAAGAPVAEPDQTLTTEPYVDIEHTSVSEVTADSADLKTVIDPRGLETHYYFRFGTEGELAGTCTEHPSSCIPAPPGIDIGNGATAETESAPVTNLAPNTTYHYRVIGINSEGSSESPDHAFTTQPPATTSHTLPDGRQYEQVSPASKGGGDIIGVAATSGGGVAQASENGENITYLSQQPFANPNGNSNASQYFSTRTPDKWSTVNISPPHEVATGGAVGVGSNYRGFSSDLSLGVISAIVPGEKLHPIPLGPETPTGYDGSNVWEASNLGFRPLVKASEVPAGTQSVGGEYQGASPDLRHVVFSSAVALTHATALAPAAPPQGGLYEETGGALTLVSVLPNGTPAAEGVLGAGTPSETFGGPEQEKNTTHAVSADGRRVYWASNRALYLRDLTAGTTAQLDKSQRTAPEGEGIGEFQTTNGDGSRAFFIDSLPLTNQSISTGGRVGETGDLYVYDANTARLTDLTVDKQPGEQSDVQGVLGTSEDGTYVYFVANGVLAEGAAPGSCVQNTTVLGATCNLYVEHYNSEPGHEQWEAPRLIAIVASGDREGFESTQSPTLLPARVTPDGTHLAFMSARSLTGYDNRDAVSGEPDEEVYLYDAGAAAAEDLTCVSCNPTGARPHGEPDEGNLAMDSAETWGNTGRPVWLAGSLPSGTNYSLRRASRQSRALADSGHRVFFGSSDALVPEDTNGQEDVYEWEQNGTGTCARHGGCIYLISSGTSSASSSFLDASTEGNDVFFLTRDQLVPEDQDALYDVYDARVCTSESPCIITPPGAAAPCASSDGCKTGSAPQPEVFGPSGSATFSGTGNATAPPASAAPKKKALTRAQELALALKACKKQRKRLRRSCEARARKAYATRRAASKTRKAGP